MTNLEMPASAEDIASAIEKILPSLDTATTWFAIPDQIGHADVVEGPAEVDTDGDIQHGKPVIYNEGSVSENLGNYLALVSPMNMAILLPLVRAGLVSMLPREANAAHFMADYVAGRDTLPARGTVADETIDTKGELIPRSLFMNRINKDLVEVLSEKEGVVQFVRTSKSQMAYLGRDEFDKRMVLQSTPVPVARASDPFHFPATLTPALADALSTMVWQSGKISRLFRQAGVEIAERAEDEQAYVLHWMIRLALEFGDDWRVQAGKIIGDFVEKVKAESTEASNG